MRGESEYHENDEPRRPPAQPDGKNTRLFLFTLFEPINYLMFCVGEGAAAAEEKELQNDKETQLLAQDNYHVSGPIFISVYFRFFHLLECSLRNLYRNSRNKQPLSV